MAEYQLTATDAAVMFTDPNDGKIWRVPNDPANRHWIDYQKWLTEGGVPDPYVEPPPIVPQATVEMTVMYDHENRLLALEGQPPLKLSDFLNKMKGG